MVSEDAVSCWPEGSGLGWRNRKQLEGALSSHSEPPQDAFCSVGIIFLQLSESKKDSLLWCYWKTEKLEGMLTVIGGKS